MEEDWDVCNPRALPVCTSNGALCCAVLLRLLRDSEPLDVEFFSISSGEVVDSCSIRQAV